MVNGEHISSGSNTAGTNDRTILWVIFLLEFLAHFHDRQWDCRCHHSSSVQGLKMFLGPLRKLSQLPLTCLSLECVTWLQRHLLSISSIWIHFWWGRLWLSGRLRLLLEVFWLSLGSRHCKSFAEIFWRDFRCWLHYLSPLGEKRNLEKWASSLPPKTCRVYTKTSILCIGSSRQRNCKHWKSSFGTTTWRNIASISAESAIWWSRKQKIIPIRLCSRSGPDGSLSFRATLWYFAAALHTLLIFSGLRGSMTGWCSKYHCSLCFVSFSSVW